MTWSRTNLLIADAAQRLGAELLPVSSEPTDHLAWLVHGQHRVLIAKTRSPFLTQVAQTLSNNKHVSRQWLATQGVPVVPDLLVDDEPDHDARIEAALARWGSVVVKPNWGNRARAVATDLQDGAAVRRACHHARACDLDEEALVEPMIAGTNVRVAVIGGRFEAAAEIVRPVLVGDGVRTVAHWVEALNTDPRRGHWDQPTRAPMDLVELSDDTEEDLAARGFTAETVVPAGHTVEIFGEEAETIECRAVLHPGWAEVAVAACAKLGVDVGGVDLRGPWSALERAPEPVWRAGGAAVLEVNVLPALHLHALPTRGMPQPVFEAFVRYCLQLPGAPSPADRQLR